GRVFDVTIEGQSELPNFDVMSAAGGRNIALTRTFDATVNDGVLDIDITRDTSVPIIRGIEILTTDGDPGGPGDPGQQITFSGTELLGTPTDTTMAVNLIPNTGVDMYVEY